MFPVPSASKLMQPRPFSSEEELYNSLTSSSIILPKVKYDFRSGRPTSRSAGGLGLLPCAGRDVMDPYVGERLTTGAVAADDD